MLHLLSITLLVASAVAIEPLPHLVARQTGAGPSACSAFFSIETSCASKIAGFTDLVFENQASCLCFQGTSFAPTVFDGYISACLGYYSTANASFFSSIGGASVPRAPCASVATLSDFMTASDDASTITGSSSGSGSDQTATATTGQSVSSAQGSATATSTSRGAANRRFSVSWNVVLAVLLAPILAQMF